MTVSIRYRLDGYDRVGKRLQRVASKYKDATDEAVGKWAKEQRRNLKSPSRYPSQRNAPQPLKTDRQRRWFFWALNAGIISVPYNRTGRLASSWRARKQGWADWAVENSAGYAAMVVGRDEQVGYHRGHWYVAEKVIEENLPKAIQEIKDAIMELAE